MGVNNFIFRWLFVTQNPVTLKTCGRVKQCYCKRYLVVRGQTRHHASADSYLLMAWASLQSHVASGESVNEAVDGVSDEAGGMPREL